MLPDDSQASPQLMTDLIERYELDLSRRAKKVSLHESIQQSLVSNPQISKQFALYQGLVWDSIATRREWLPSVTLDSPLAPAGYSQKSIEFYKRPQKTQVSSRDFTMQNGYQYNPQLKAAWSLLSLSRSSRLASQKDNIYSQELRLRQSIRELVFNVQSDYYALQMARQEEDVYQGIFDFSRNLIAQLSAQKSSPGYGKIIAALKARSLQSLSLRVSSQQEVIRLSAALASQMGLPGDAFVLPSQKLALDGEWTSRLNQTLQEASQRREEIKIAESQSNALSNQADALLRNYIPEVSIEAAAKFEANNYGLNKTGSEDYHQDGYTLDKSLGLRFKWTIFDSGVLAAQASSFRKKALASQKQAALDQLVINSQVKSAYAVYSSQLIQLPVVKRELDQSLLSLGLRVEESSYPTVTTISNLIQALDQYQSAASRWFLTIKKYNTATAQLYRYTSQWPNGVDELVGSSLQYLNGIDLEATR